MSKQFPVDVQYVTIKPEYWNVIRKYQNKNLEIKPYLIEDWHPLLSPKKIFVQAATDIPEFKTSWMFSNAHVKELSVFPPRVLIQNSMHSSFSKEAVANAITGYSEKTAQYLKDTGKYAAIESAQKFITATETPTGTVFEKKGVVIIPYAPPAKDKSHASVKAFEDKGQQANFTVRTNSKGMKYARMATNAYNEVENVPVLPRMPYVPFGNLTPETKYVADAMLLDDLSMELALKPGESRSSRDIRYALCKELEKVQDNSKKPPIYIIEGEKKALALYTANEALRESQLIDSLSGKSPSRNIEPIEVVGVSGVWQTLSGTTELQPDLLECVDFKDRDVVILYDTDMKHNHQIVNAISAFALGLKNAGAKSVNMVYPNIPSQCVGQEDKCKGFDDMVETLLNTADNTRESQSARLREAYLNALEHVQQNITPIKSVGNTYREIKTAFLPFNNHSKPTEDALAVIADNPQQQKVYR